MFSFIVIQKQQLKYKNWKIFLQGKSTKNLHWWQQTKQLKINRVLTNWAESKQLKKHTTTCSYQEKMDSALILMTSMELLIQSIMDWRRAQNNEIDKQICRYCKQLCLIDNKSMISFLEGKEDLSVILMERGLAGH